MRRMPLLFGNELFNV